MKIKFKNLIVLFTIFLSPAAFAEDVSVETEVELDKIVVSASLQPKTLRQVSQSVHVVTSKTIQKSNFTHVGQILKSLPGIQTISSGSPGDDLDIRFRGSDRDEVLVLIDGIPINNLTESRAQWLNTIPVDLIEKVEVIKGAQSVIYGTSAVAGIINIITKKGDETPFHMMGFTTGNLGLFKETVASSGKYGKHQYAASFSRHDQKGRIDNDRYGANNFFANYGYNFSEKLKLEFGLLYSDQKQELPYASATSFANFPRLDFYTARDSDRFMNRNTFIPRVALEWNATDFYTARFSYGMYYEDTEVQNSNRNDVSPDPFATLESQQFSSRGHRHNFDLRNIFHVMDRSSFKVDVTAGVNGQLEYLEFDDNPYPGDTTTKVATSFPGPTQQGSRRNISGYGELGVSWREMFHFGAGIRLDDNDTFGQAISPRLSLSYFNDAIKSKFFTTFSQGFIAPTLNQYYLAVIGGTLTQRLDKETSQTFEIGFNKEPLNLASLGEVSFGSTFFYTNYDTVINELQLVNNAHVIGVESFFKYEPVKWLELNANYTYMQATNDDNGTSLANRARHQFYGDLQVKPIKRLSFIFSAFATSHRIIPSILSTATLGDLTVASFDELGNQSGTSLPSYYLLNAAAQYRLDMHSKWMKEFRFSLRANNLLNKSYQEKFGYNMPKFNILGGADIIF